MHTIIVVIINCSYAYAVIQLQCNYTITNTLQLHRVINGVSELIGELSVELYDPNDCEDNVFTTEELAFGQYQLFKNIDVAE